MLADFVPPFPPLRFFIGGEIHEGIFFFKLNYCHRRTNMLARPNAKQMFLLWAPLYNAIKVHFFGNVK